MVYLIQENDEVREATAEEIKHLEEITLAHEQFMKEEEQKEQARQSALAKLVNLGLTQEEISALYNV